MLSMLDPYGIQTFGASQTMPSVVSGRTVGAESGIITFEHDVEVKHCNFNGSLEARGYADVYIEDVDFYVYESVSIMAMDHAKVVINGSRFHKAGTYPHLEVHLYNHSQLTIQDTLFEFDPVYVYAYDSSKITVINGQNISAFYVYDNGNLTIIGDFPDLDVDLYGDATLMFHNAKLTDDPYVKAYDRSIIVMGNTNYTNTIDLYSKASLYVNDSYIECVYTNDTNYLSLSNVTMYLLAIEWDSIAYIYDSNITLAKVQVGYDHKGTLKYGPKAVISSSIIETLQVFSFVQTQVINSEIQNLYYSNIYEGSLNVSPSKKEFVVCYDSYVNSGSTIGSAVNSTSYVFVRNASYVEIHDVSEPTRIYLLNVDDAKIYNKDFPGKNLGVYAWGGYVNITNASCVNFDVYFFEVNGHINDVGPVGTLDITMYYSSVGIDTINGSTASWCDIEARNSTMSIYDASLNNLDIEITHTLFFGQYMNVTASCDVESVDSDLYMFYSELEGDVTVDRSLG